MAHPDPRPRSRPRRHAPAPVPPEPTTAILSLLDALMVIDDLADATRPPGRTGPPGPGGPNHGVLVLDAHQRLIDLRTGHEQGRYPFSLADAADWAHRRAAADPAATKFLFYSCGLADVRVLDEPTISRYQQLRRGAAGAGIEVLDWILADAGQFRSMACAVHPQQAWSTQPTERRAETLRLLTVDSTDDGPTDDGPTDDDPMGREPTTDGPW